MDILKINNLFAGYGDKKVLKDVSMNIKRNKITAIIGPSGCGKSTFLTTLNRMIEENGGNFTGEILYKDEDILSYEKDSIRKNIGMVFQKPTPFPFSIYKNLTYAPIYYGITSKAELDKIVETNLKEAGLFDEINKDLHMLATKLSGGQQQRLCIARALTAKPEVLLLDEPCSALDIKNIQNIEEMLLRFSRDYTIIIVTHNLAQAKRISDYTAFILDGELIEYEKTEKIFTNPIDSRTKEYIEGIYG
ncbi:phosphate ABC transporter ATP-binding protein, PhoT family [Desulfonispora thiosulfatigenes DSM 11270]|uniref:Phosphate ABC transporter ATP-binding protein, PhoT family n=1 Tax=Desulfonispora thiosulfatigenes DSM 11270 TaxID=656914 RepID=A0A1W1VF90_DESTI|nr:phosphate ABC transporter ATP-binding protein [Desulfonispora thiosulfatigenes]SMB91883.1 phosphate ABC transporter ATP-binding protein, PhoT family [Desulfonispora thiosulfatigenes DSM 11270]